MQIVQSRKNLYGAALLLMIALSGCATPDTRGWDSPDTWRAKMQTPLAQESALPLASDPSLGQALRLGLERNPGLHALREQWLAAIQRIPQAQSLSDPSLQVGYQFTSVETRVGSQEGNLGLTQRLPWWRKLWARGKAAEIHAAVAGLRYDAGVRDLIIEIKDTWYELYYLDRAIPITGRIAAQLRNDGLLAYGELDSGRAQLGEAFRAESQAAQLEYDILLLTEQRASQAERLRSLLNLPPATEIGQVTHAPVYEVNGDIDSLFARAERHAQILRIKGMEIQKTQYQAYLARLSRIPDVAIGFNTIFTDSALMPGTPGSGKNPFIGLLSMNLPIWEQRNRALIAEKQALEAAAKAFALEELNRNRRAVASAYFHTRITERLVALYRETLLPQAESVMQQAQLDFRAEASSYSNVLESTLAYHNFLLAYHRALADHGQAVGRLERVVGAVVSETPGGEDASHAF